MEINKPHTLYYSKQCINCQDFMQKLEANAFIKDNFNMVSVDEEKVDPRITFVPAILIDGNNIHFGSQAFEWLEATLKTSVDSYDIGCSTSNGSFFSFIESDGKAEKIEQFTYLNEDTHIANPNETARNI